MDILKKVVGPKSKYDNALPYTYMAKRPTIVGSDLYEHYFGHTICSLVAYLDQKDIPSHEVELFGIFRKQEVLLDISLITDKSGKWLGRPAICHVLESHYRKTKDKIYRGHREHEVCRFDDRKLKGYGPY